MSPRCDRAIAALFLVGLVVTSACSDSGGSGDDEARQPDSTLPAEASTTGLSPGWSTVEDIGNAMTVSLPEGWSLAASPLADVTEAGGSWISADPAELVAFGNGDLAYGWGRECSPHATPSRALQSLDPDAAMVQVVERRVREGDFEPRPASLDETTVPAWEPECEAQGVDAPSEIENPTVCWNIEIVAPACPELRRITFETDNEGEIAVLVAIGAEVDDGERANLWEAVDRLAFDPVPAERDALMVGVPFDLVDEGMTLRTDLAIDSVPWPSYPWFQIQTWSGDAPFHPSDRRMTLVVAPVDDEFLARSSDPELIQHLADHPEGVAGGSESLPGWEHESPKVWLWWKPSDDTVALLAGQDMTIDELEVVAFDSHWEEQPIEPGGGSWQNPFPVTCTDAESIEYDEDPLGPRPPEEVLPPLGMTSLEYLLLRTAGSHYGGGGRPVSLELVPWEGEEWYRDDTGEVVTTPGSGVQARYTAIEGSGGSPQGGDMPVDNRSCRPGD